MKRDFSALANQEFDLLVCGGGIYGAWTAYDAAQRGLSVAIVEQGDWASGTSSASSKLIHGGLRYLESYDFKLVRKALAEREMLLQVAPHRVWPLNFGVPVYAESRVGSLRLQAGLTLYDLLAGKLFSKSAHHHLDHRAFAERFPNITTADLTGGFVYGDAQTDDARLVLELIDGAIQHGATCVNYCKLTEWMERQAKVCGAIAQDQVSQKSIKISAGQIVSTTGQWTAASAQGQEWCRLTKGVHLILPPTGMDEALLLTAKSDGRVFFIIPWYGMTLLGTTDTAYGGNPDHVTVEPQDIRYLLNEANHYLKTAWTEADVAGSYAGVRTMKRSKESSPSAMSRDWELVTSDNGVHYSIGGKITSAREDAENIVNRVCIELKVNKPCLTDGAAFPWIPAGDYAEWNTSVAMQARQLGVDAESGKWLVRRHGKRVVAVLDSIAQDTQLAKRVIPELPFIDADLLFCACNEMVIHLDDLLRRRVPLLILARLTEDKLKHLAQGVAKILCWDEKTVGNEIVRCQQMLSR